MSTTIDDRACAFLAQFEAYQAFLAQFEAYQEGRYGVTRGGVRPYTFLLRV